MPFVGPDFDGTEIIRRTFVIQINVHGKIFSVNYIFVLNSCVRVINLTIYMSQSKLYLPTKIKYIYDTWETSVYCENNDNDNTYWEQASGNLT